jgi:hypothetical protein
MGTSLSLAVAKRLAQSDEQGSRWVGKDALTELASSKVHSRLARRAQSTNERKQ